LKRLGVRGDVGTVHVLLGDAEAASGFLEQAQVAHETREGMRTPCELHTPAKLANARQGTLDLSAGSHRLYVQLPGFCGTTFPISVLTGFITVLVISREHDGAFDVQHHFNPIDPTQPVRPGLRAPLLDDVRLVELGWRALHGQHDLSDVEYGELLTGKRANPMLAVIAGYRMFGTSREGNFRPAGIDSSTEVGESPLWNMVLCFPELSDVHVLAALYDPEHRHAHLERARAAGIPLLWEGYRLLLAELVRSTPLSAEAPPLVRRPVGGGPYTTFAEAKAVDATTTVFVAAAGVAEFVDERSLPLPPEITSAVGRVVRSNGVAGSAILVAPTIAICSGSCLHPGAALAEIAVFFDADAFRISRILERLPISLDDVPDNAEFPHAMLSGGMPVLVELDGTVPRRPLRISSQAAATGDAVVVVGFPGRRHTLASKLGDLFADSVGWRHYIPAAITDVVGTIYRYDGRTAQGVSGGPVIDVRTQLVVAMHFAYGTTEARTEFDRADPTRRVARRGYGFSLASLAEHPAITRPRSAPTGSRRG
jgi:hypothetical protein